MANDLLQERIQHSGILGPTHPANHIDVMLHRKLVSEEVTVLDLRINHRGDSEEEWKASPHFSPGIPISGEYIKDRMKKCWGHESWQPGEVCSGDGRSAGLKGD